MKIKANEVAIPVPLAQGGTGAITKSAAFDALSPMTTGGDLIYGGASGTGTRLANGNAGDHLRSNGTTLAPSWEAPTVAATQSDQETATSTTTYVSPGVQQFHPSASKAWVYFHTTTSTAIDASYNITGLTDNGTGNTTITIATDFSSANYSSAGMSCDNGSGAGLSITSIGQTAGALQVLTFTSSTLAAADSARVGVSMFGDQ